MQNSSLIINGTTFLNNTSRGEGGGVAAVNATVLQIYNSSMLFNTAKNGGGLFVEDCGRATFFQNTWTGNLAKKAGGALWQTKCSGDVTENSFRNNRGELDGWRERERKERENGKKRKKKKKLTSFLSSYRKRNVKNLKPEKNRGQRRVDLAERVQENLAPGQRLRQQHGELKN